MLITCLFLVLIATVSGQQEGDACVDQFTNATGVCKPVDKCETTKQDLEQSGIKPTFCSQIPSGNTLACCRDGLNIFDTPVTGRSARAGDLPTWGFASSEGRSRVSERKCIEYSSKGVIKIEFLLLLLKPEIVTISIGECGDHTASLPGKTAELGEFPHMVALGYKGVKNKYDFLCGGSLISERFVLTAARCSKSRLHDLRPPDIVRLGDHHLDDSVNDGATIIDVPIRRIHVHPDYTTTKQYNDIALVELSDDVIFDFKVRPACLWTKPNFPGYDKAIATGWNLFHRNKTLQEQELTKVSINLFENSHCAVLMDDYKTRKWPAFNDSQMCAGELKEKWDPCMTESGSPLQVASNENPCVFYILGIQSLSVSCTKHNIPLVYTRLSTYLNWIERTVWPGQ